MRKNTENMMKGAALGLLAGSILVAVTMVVWDYLITPCCLGYPGEAVARLLLPVLLPLSLLKAGLNAAGTFLLCQPVSKALSRAGLLPKKEERNES